MHMICMLQLVLVERDSHFEKSVSSLYISGTGCIKTLLKLPIIRVKIDQSESRIFELTTI